MSIDYITSCKGCVFALNNEHFGQVGCAAGKIKPHYEIEQQDSHLLIKNQICQFKRDKEWLKDNPNCTLDYLVDTVYYEARLRYDLGLNAEEIHLNDILEDFINHDDGFIDRRIIYCFEKNKYEQILKKLKQTDFFDYSKNSLMLVTTDNESIEIAKQCKSTNIVLISSSEMIKTLPRFMRWLDRQINEFDFRFSLIQFDTFKMFPVRYREDKFREYWLIELLTYCKCNIDYDPSTKEFNPMEKQ